MIKNDESLNECLQTIQQHLNWGQARNWSDYDFDKLADLIQDKTGVLLSITTLKRLFGKLRYDNLPSVTTLNTLARFLDFADWREFCQRPVIVGPPSETAGYHQPSKEDVPDKIENAPALEVSHSSVATVNESPAKRNDHTSSADDPLKTDDYLASHDHPPRIQTDRSIFNAYPRPAVRNLVKGRRGYLLIALLAALVIAAMYSLTPREKVKSFSDLDMKSRPDPAEFAFKADKMVGEGVPNSVIFSYDASKATTDSIYITQTWDITRKTLVSRHGKAHSAMYYYPGFFRTKLIVGETVVKAHDLQITSNGWLCLAEQEPEPIYFKKELYLKSDRVEVDSKTLKAYGLTLHPVPPKLRFFNQGDMGDLMNDNFVFETTVKNDFAEGSAACQRIQILIQCKDDIITIPLAAPGCVGNLRLFAAGIGVNSKEGDLSRFGCNLKEWTKLRVETVNAQMTFYVNGVKAYSFRFPNPPTGIVGVQYRFDGVGAVKDTRFTGMGKSYEL